MFFTHGIIDSRPFTIPIIRHYKECGHESEEDGIDNDILRKILETFEWGRDASQDSLQIAAAGKAETSIVKDEQVTLTAPLRIFGSSDVIMIDDD
jgi:hypothetical protein